MTTTTIDLDRQRAEFEAWAREEWPDGSLEGTYTSDGWYYFDDVPNDFWICWKAARRSNAGEAAGIKTWEQRAAERGAEGRQCYRDWPNMVFDELLELRAALATQQAARAQQEPVAGASTAAVEQATIRRAANLLKARGFPELHDELKAMIHRPTSGRESAASVAQQDAKDAARWQWLRKQHNSGDEQWFVYGATSADLDADIDDVMQKGGVDNV